MKNGIKKILAAGCVCASLLGVGAGAAYADTVYYKGSAVAWDHGRWAGLWSFSDVQSTVYEHSATANTTSSGWQQPGVKASAKQFVGPGKATAYWNCRG
ncbi:MAG: hypothetical protein PUK59_01860 [Actinomycetaceae bacterium]|nr:hypothetical protein [Actinomycetaceae bacterium]MDY5853909.1 hypothetical protein [Arcanobacterium sp.]